MLSNPGLALEILSWVLAEQMAGKSPTSVEIGKQFGITPEAAEKIREELEAAGEF